MAAKNALSSEERNKFLPVMKALVKVMETNTPAPEDVNTLLVLTRDLTKNLPKGIHDRLPLIIHTESCFSDNTKLFLGQAKYPYKCSKPLMLVLILEFSFFVTRGFDTTQIVSFKPKTIPGLEPMTSFKFKTRFYFVFRA